VRASRRCHQHLEVPAACEPGNPIARFVIANVFLLLNGFEIEANEPEAVNIMIGVADGSLSRDEFAAWIRSRLVRFTG
jgi:prophage maintenance system killer protein